MARQGRRHLRRSHARFGHRKPGTTVYLTCKSDAEEIEDLFRTDRLIELARHYGGLLPIPIRLTSGRQSRTINAEPPPWRRPNADPRKRTAELIDYGNAMLGDKFFDAIPLDDPALGVDGVAYVLSASPSATARQQHRVYLKNMFLADRVDNLLPPWAFFVRMIVNVTTLRPTASREGFQEEAKLGAVREGLGDRLRRYIVDLAQRNPEKLQRLIEIHQLTIKALAVADDDFYRLVIDFLPVLTSEAQ